MWQGLELFERMPQTTSSPELVRTQLQRVLSSRGFARNGRLSGFLRFVVEQELSGRGNELKESIIGVEYFGRRPDYDVRQDSVVRNEAGKLRARLAEYYVDEGAADALIIELPKGGYKPAFRHVENPTAPVPGPHGSRRRIWLWLGIALAGSAIGLAVSWWQGGIPHSNAPIPIAVLPLINLDRNPDHDYFADGLTGEIIRNLSIIEGLAVRSQTSSFALKGKSQNVHDVGRQLDAEYVVEGSVLLSGRQLRINAQLVRVRDDFPLWSGKYDRELTDVFYVQDEISREIVNHLRLKLGRGEPAPVVSDTSNMEAYNLYLLGRNHWSKRNESDLEAAVHDFEAAVRLDPAYARAYAGLADTYLQLGTWGSRDARVMMPKAAQYAVKALELNESLADAHTALGAIHLLYDWDAAAARREYERAIVLNPGYVTAHWWFAFLLLASGELPDAQRELDRALRLDPLSVPVLVDAVSFYIETGDPQRALPAAQKALEIDPTSMLARISLGSALASQNRLKEALVAFEQATADQANARALQFLAGGHAKLGHREDVEKAITQLLRLSKTTFVNCEVAAAYADAGQSDLALVWLQRAVESRSACVGWLRLGRFGGAFEPFRALVSSARYRAILANAVPNR
jgi:TolB-like protein/tetratricopeptide (TPR) repeat protein